MIEILPLERDLNSVGIILMHIGFIHHLHMEEEEDLKEDLKKRKVFVQQGLTRMERNIG
jgi:hypothetical protein